MCIRDSNEKISAGSATRAHREEKKKQTEEEGGEERGRGGGVVWEGAGKQPQSDHFASFVHAVAGRETGQAVRVAQRAEIGASLPVEQTHGERFADKSGGRVGGGEVTGCQADEAGVGGVVDHPAEVGQGALDVAAVPAGLAAAVVGVAVFGVGFQGQVLVFQGALQVGGGPAADADLGQDFDAFCAAQASWLDDYALFMAPKEEHALATWSTWPKDLVQRDPLALEAARAR